MSVLLAAAISLNNVDINESCNLELDQKVEITEQRLVIENERGHQLVVKEGTSLYIDDEFISLNKAQRKLLNRYDNAVRQEIPEVAELALDAVDLATGAVGQAFGELLGADSRGTESIVNAMTGLRDRLEREFFPSKELSRFQLGDANSVWSAEFEQEFEHTIEQAIESTIGHLLVNLGKEILFGGDMQAFEAKMENFGEKLEHDIEAKAAVIEKKAESLCHGFSEVDIIENQIQQQVEQFKDFDMVRIKHHQM